jgi:hypothetical protein
VIAWAKDAPPPGAPPGPLGPMPDADTRAGPSRKEHAPIRCARCGAPIAHPRDRVEIDGAHVHTFVNPSAVTYRVACFRDAPGCVGLGEWSSFWTWFRGYAWQIAHCRGCGVHLGWAYRGASSAFHGLIADRIVEPGGH